MEEEKRLTADTAAALIRLLFMARDAIPRNSTIPNKLGDWSTPEDCIEWAAKQYFKGEYKTFTEALNIAAQKAEVNLIEVYNLLAEKAEDRRDGK